MEKLNYEDELWELYEMAKKCENISMALHILQLLNKAKAPMVASEELKKTV